MANVGDSRGVMCDGKGNAIPLSFDHKPQQVCNLYMYIFNNEIYFSFMKIIFRKEKGGE